jgi:hypothetical protein
LISNYYGDEEVGGKRKKGIHQIKRSKNLRSTFFVLCRCIVRGCLNGDFFMGGKTGKIATAEIEFIDSMRMLNTVEKCANKN